MYLRLTRAHYDSALADQVATLTAEISAAVAQLPGLQHLYQATDRAAGTTVAVSIWDTEEHARFSRDELGDIIARIQEQGVQLDPPEIFEVL